MNASCANRIFNASGNLTTPASFGHNNGRSHLGGLGMDPSDYTIESLGGGSVVSVLDNITMPGQDTIATSRLDVTVSESGDFTSGVILWPTTAISFNQRDEYQGEQFRHLNGSIAHRNGLEYLQQEYASTSADPPDDPKDGLPVLLTGLAVEIDGDVTFSNLSTPAYDRCWQSSGWGWGNMSDYGSTTPNNAWSLAGDGKPTNDQLFDIRCFISAPVDSIDRIGFVIALSSWKLFGYTWTSLGLGVVDHTERLFVAKPRISSCWQDQCDCYHHDVNVLEATIDGSNNPEEFIGEVVTLNRAWGSTDFIGSVSKPSNNRPDIQSLDMDETDGPIDETVFTYEISFSYGNNGEAGPSAKVPLSRITNEPTAAQVQTEINSVIADYGGSETVTCSGGPLPTASIIITSDTDVLLNWIHESVTWTRIGPGPDVVNPYCVIRRTEHGIPAKTLTADFTLSIRPDTLSFGTINLTPRMDRSCNTLYIDAGGSCDYINSWLQNAPVAGSPSPFARTYTRSGGGASLDFWPCEGFTRSHVKHMIDAGYEQVGGYAIGLSNIGFPFERGGVQLVFGPGWNVVVTEP